jgi:hypothetical protein
MFAYRLSRSAVLRGLRDNFHWEQTAECSAQICSRVWLSDVTSTENIRKEYLHRVLVGNERLRGWEASSRVQPGENDSKRN